MTMFPARSRSRRQFLHSAAIVSGGCVVLPGGLGAWLKALQPTALDKRRADAAAAPIVTTKLTDRLALLSGPGGNVVVFHGPDGMLVVDGFVKPAWPKLSAALAAIDSRPVKTMIDTHWHYDHADNNGRFREEGAAVIAHENTKLRLMQSHDLLGMHFDPVSASELPTQTFKSGLKLNINGEQVDLRHVLPAHTDTDILVHFPGADVLHMGDLFFNGFYPFIDASTGGTIDGLIETIGMVLKMLTARTRIVPGHGPVATRGSLEAYHVMLTAIRDRVRAEKKAGKSLAEVQATKPSAAFDPNWGRGGMAAADFIALVYNTTR